MEENCAASNIRPSGSAYIYSDVLLQGKMSDVGNVNCIRVFTLLKKRRWDGMREGEELKKKQTCGTQQLKYSSESFLLGQFSVLFAIFEKLSLNPSGDMKT